MTASRLIRVRGAVYTAINPDAAEADARRDGYAGIDRIVGRHWWVPASGDTSRSVFGWIALDHEDD